MVKADGLAAGKGVTVCDDVAEADAALGAVFADGDDPGRARRGSSSRSASGGPRRASSPCATAATALALPAARDHKRLGDGDTGPNTGGMGAYSPLPDVDPALVAEIVARFHRPALAELARRGMPFRGALYAGLILTADRGPVLLEFNARFGDPETQAILPRVAIPLAPLLLAAAPGRPRAGRCRARAHAATSSRPTPEAAVAIVLATRDYPAAPSAGDPITGLDAAAATGALVFHAGTRRATGRGLGDERRARPGGRRAAVATWPPRARPPRRAADAICFAGLRRRHDIAAEAPRPARPRRGPGATR